MTTKIEEITTWLRRHRHDPRQPWPGVEVEGDELQPLLAAVSELVAENRALRRNHRAATAYIRGKVDQLLTIIGTVPLRPEELDDATLISLDPIGIVAESFRRILTNSRATNEKLHLAMQDIQGILEAVGGGVLVLDSGKRIVSYNQKYREMLGWQDQDGVGRTCREFICRGDHPQGCVFDEMMRSGRTARGVYCGQRGSRHYNVVASPIKDGEGRIVRAVLLYNDITELVEAKAAVAEEKERLFFTLASIAEGVIATGREGRIVLMNQVAEQLTGWSSSEAVGRSLCDILRVFDEDDRHICLDILGNVLLGGDDDLMGGSASIRQRDGRKLIFTMSAAPIRGQDRAVTGAIVVFRDVTQEKKLEEEMIKSSRIESIGLLAGGIAHDFNNLLTAMLGNVSLAKMFAEPDGKVYELLTQTEKASSRARILTQQLLTFAKGGKPVKSLVYLRELLKEFADFSLSGSSVKCEQVIAEDLWPVEVDQGQICQVIQNLIINAVQAMPGGGVVRIQAENMLLDQSSLPPSLSPGKYVQLSVQDQGEGIANRDINRIFDPYYTTKELGHGLGLAICYSIITKHQGRISVESEPGVGTTFFILLPAADPESFAAALVEKKRGPAGGRGRVLVMDDEEVVRDVASQMISFLGYEVDPCCDGEEALAMYLEAMADGRPYDVVLMDLTIPGGMGGQEAVARLLQLDPGARVLASSGYSNDPIMAEFARYGFKGVAPKPYGIEDLADLLERVMRN
ncbi:PAS domain S-box protein [Desulfurivibrio sp. D14AmB]|uniref:hybrid sensor histidine kinase/response regulator n=1 Tax=Desulfurivibrio sp. D14AmB TaxID=3374370 RepID=UPI00376EA57E